MAASYPDRILIKTAAPYTSIGMDSDKFYFNTDDIFSLNNTEFFPEAYSNSIPSDSSNTHTTNSHSKRRSSNLNSETLHAKKEEDTVTSKEKTFNFKFEKNYPLKPNIKIYTSLPDKFSDHRPIFGHFEFDIPFLRTDRIGQLKELAAQKVRDLLSLGSPSPKIENLPDKLNLKENESLSITIKNDGPAWLRWSATMRSAEIVEDFSLILKISPFKGVLLPNQSCKVEITALKVIKESVFLMFLHEKKAFHVTEVNIVKK